MQAITKKPHFCHNYFCFYINSFILTISAICQLIIQYAATNDEVAKRKIKNTSDEAKNCDEI